MRKMKRIFILLCCLLLLVSIVGCNDNNQGTENPPPNGETPEIDYTLPENYDFGDPSGWAGETATATDLGDCLMEPYPYDERYDWGQSILYDREEGVYKMWWCRHSGYDSIWYAESADLKNWTNVQKLMAPEIDTTWIKMHVGKPTVLKLEDKYVMYFEAPATLRGWAEFDNNVFYAESPDGINWRVFTEKDLFPDRVDADDTIPYPAIRMSEEQMAASWQQAEKEGGSGYGYYGIGQPSALVHDGAFYVYCTYAMESGDRMYLFRSNDGMHFDDGVEVFVRAGCGVKYNTLTQKFMMAYEYTTGSVSRVYYMQSDDGVRFTYADYATASNNKNILSRGTGFVRGYPDFVHDGTGNVNTHTVYVSFMEGKMADAGYDWRQYSSTWDIHIAMFNPPEYANRTKILPNGRVHTSETIEPYRAAHVPFDDRLVGISRANGVPAIDGAGKSFYDSATVLNIDRTVCADRAVPGKISAVARVAYSDEYLYVFIEVTDSTRNDDYICLFFAESKASKEKDALYIESTRSGVTVTTLADRTVRIEREGLLAAVSETDKGYNLEARIPLPAAPQAYSVVAFDCFVFDNYVNANNEWKSTLAWSDYKTQYKIKYAGELAFLP